MHQLVSNWSAMWPKAGLANRLAGPSAGRRLSMPAFVLYRRFCFAIAARDLGLSKLTVGELTAYSRVPTLLRVGRRGRVNRR